MHLTLKTCKTHQTNVQHALNNRNRHLTNRPFWSENVRSRIILRAGLNNPEVADFVDKKKHYSGNIWPKRSLRL